MKFCCAVVLLLCSAMAGRAADRPNVLLIMADDLRPELGCYGVARAFTPNLDKLAAQSVRFDRAYCQAPLCNPSRVSMLTGRYPTTTEVMETNSMNFREVHPDWVTLPEYFKENGYAAATVGKIFHETETDPQSWTEVLDVFIPEGLTLPPPVGWTPSGGNEGEYDPLLTDRIVVANGNGENLRDYYIEKGGIELLNKYKDRPFFIAIGFTNTHAPLSAPQKYFALHDPSKIELPPDFAVRPTAPKGFPKESIPPLNTDLFVGRDASPQAARKMIQAYRAATSWVDSNVGAILNELDRLGLSENTIVIFTSDHGYHLGEKGKWSKTRSLFEVGARVPLLVRLPGAAGNGGISPRTVELVDIYPTLTQLCALPTPPELGGQSFAALLRNPLTKWFYPAFTINNTLDRSVRIEGWRYTTYQGKRRGGPMLFDERADPHEMTNLAKDPRKAKVLAKMRALMQLLPTNPRPIFQAAEK